ncbi:hypothetical protein ACFVH6_05435 [Spirillospora sp. NPDC127200]
MTSTDRASVFDALKVAASALKAADVRFALAGSLAAHARGGWSDPHDVDFAILESSVPEAMAALRAAGLQVEDPAEDWLVKAYSERPDGGRCLVDLLFRPAGTPVTEEMLDRARELQVESVIMPVLAATDLITLLLLSLTEQHCDFGPPLRVSRPLREQIDWKAVLGATEHSAYARSFIFLLRQLNVLEPVQTAVSQTSSGNRATAVRGERL